MEESNNLYNNVILNENLIASTYDFHDFISDQNSKYKFQKNVQKKIYPMNLKNILNNI